MKTPFELEKIFNKHNSRVLNIAQMQYLEKYNYAINVVGANVDNVIGEEIWFTGISEQAIESTKAKQALYAINNDTYAHMPNEFKQLKDGQKPKSR